MICYIFTNSSKIFLLLVEKGLGWIMTIIAVSVGEEDKSSFPEGSQARWVTGTWPGCFSTCAKLVEGLKQKIYKVETEKNFW